MPQPVDVAADLLVTRYDDIEEVTVESLDPDLEHGSDVTATATGVRAIVGPETESEPAMGGGQATVKIRDFTLIAGDLAFELKTRDRITRTDGTKWHTADVKLGGFGGLYECEKCVREQ